MSSILFSAVYGVVMTSMIETPNIGLEVWDQGKDDFSHSELASNWVAIDNHDHSPGRGAQLGSSSIKPGAITTVLLAAESVAAGNIKDEAVGTEQLAPNSVTSAIIAPGGVEGSNIATGAVSADKLEAGVQPLGTVVMWYRKSGTTNLPGGGWEICDGRPWSEITNSLGYSTGHIPDMRNAMALGADINGEVGPSIGVPGGNNTVNLAHAHSVNSHTHGVPSHVHGIAADGNHGHGFKAVDGNYYPAYSRFVRATGGNPPYAGVLHLPQDPDSPGESEIPAPLEFTGEHNHTGATAGSAPLNTAASGATTDNRLGGVDIRSQNVSLLFIMRVR